MFRRKVICCYARDLGQGHQVVRAVIGGDLWS